jgi:aminoglycoside 3-N-acetyltransferase
LEENNFYKERLIADFRKLGVNEDDNLLVHSSLRSLGSFDNKAEIIISSLIQLLGKKGSLLMPALSYETVTRSNPYFDVNTTKSCVGALTEYFRTMKGVKRSIHPTHSVCCLGKETAFFLDDHYKDTTPCGKNSPFSRLEQINGKILFLGCGLKPNTSMHAIEELIEPSYLFDEKILYNMTLPNDEKIKKIYIPHNFKGYLQRYDRLAVLLDSNEYSKGNVLNADCWLIKTKPMWKKALQALNNDPFYFVEKKLGNNNVH